MLRLLLFPLVVALLSAQTLGAQQSAAQQSAAQEAQDSQLVERLLQLGDAADPAQFAVLAKFQSRAALQGLQRIVARLQHPPLVREVYLAFVEFRGSPLEGEARAHLRDSILAGGPPERLRSQTRGLASFGSAAAADLEAVVDRAWDPHCRSIALGPLVPALRYHGGTRSLKRVLAYFEPGLSGPRRLGASLLASFREPAERELLHEALVDEAMPMSRRSLVFDALALQGDAEALQWLKGQLDARSAGARLAALRALEGAEHAWSTPVLTRLMRDPDARVRHAAALARAQRLRADPAVFEREVLELARDDDWALRMAGAELLVAVPGPAGEAGEARLVELLEDEDADVRRQAIRGLALRRERRSVELLLERMEQDTLRLAEEAREGLVRLCARDLGANPARWRAFWDAEGTGFVLPTSQEVLAFLQRREARAGAGRTRAEFFGVDIGSDRVVFVLDTSGSMDSPVALDATRMDLVKAEFERVLGQLPRGSLLNVLLFSTRVRRFKPRLFELDASTSSRAVRWVQSKKPMGWTALYDGLLEALEDERVDTLVVLSDGQPSGGSTDDPDRIYEDVVARIGPRDIRVHTIGLQVESLLLERLAQATGGEYRVVSGMPER